MTNDANNGSPGGARSFVSLPVLLLLGCGLGVRLIQYLYNRSLRIDEAWLSRNILTRSYSQLLSPLDNDQAAPVGFLFVEKFFTDLLGSSEYALRLFPLLSGIAALLVFHSLLRKTTGRSALLVALILFVTSRELVFYSSDVKQYSSDVFCSVLVLYAASCVLARERLDSFHVVYVAALGSLLIWLSHPVAFVLVGVGLSLAVKYVSERGWCSMRQMAGLAAAWTLSAGLSYVLSVGNAVTNRELRVFWSEDFDSFMPFPPRSAADLQWFPTTFLELFARPAGIGASIEGLSGVAALAFLAGVLVLARRSYAMLALFLSPFLVTLVASGLRLYPFADRLLLFLVPMIYLFIAEGVAWLVTTTKKNSPWFAGMLVGLLLWEPVSSATNFVRFMPRKEMKPALAHISQESEAGDRLYLNGASTFVFDYYSDRYDLSHIRVHKGKYPDSIDTAVRELAALEGASRIWLLLSDFRDNEESLIRTLDSLGVEQLEQTVFPGGVTVRLCDFSDAEFP